MKHNLRLFVAAPLPASVAEELTNYLEPYEKPGVRIVPQENWHLTIHFIGSVPASRLPEIKQNLNEILSGFEVFTLKLVRVAPGPNAIAPRLVWAMFAENKTFENMVRKVTIGLGDKIEHQHPVPHVTVARYAKDLAKPPKLPVQPAERNLYFEVTEIALWESESGGLHQKYTILETFPLSTGIGSDI